MASTYTTNLGIEKIGTGEQSGTWGDTTNTNLDLIDEAVNGIISITLSSAGSSGSPNSLPITDGASSNGRNKFIEFVDGGDLGGTAYVQLTPNDAEKIVHIRNSLSSSRSIIVFQGTYSASNDFEIVNGADVLLKFNGGGSGATVTDVNVDLTVTGLTATTFTSTGIDDNAGSTAITIDSSQDVTFTSDAKFPDSGKAIFGAGSDLQIYHDGSNSYIKEDGTGNLIVAADDFRVTNVAVSETLIGADTDGVVTLYHDGSSKLTTTSTGIDVTGTAVTDGLTVAGNVSVDDGTIKLDGSYPVGTRNTALGDTAFDSAASGASYNVAVGYQAMTSNTTGTHNVGVGYSALGTNTTGHSNTSLGFSPLASCTTGAYNTAVGYEAVDASTTASSNVGLGYQALTDVTTGNGNTAVGTNAGANLVTDSYVTAIGHNALTTNTGHSGSLNVAVGGYSQANSTSYYNTSVGYRTLEDSTSHSNTAVGRQALAESTSGTENSALGNMSMQITTSASYSTGLGSQALYSLTTGSYNTAVGRSAAISMTSGTNSVAVGNNALNSRAGGHHNVAVGVNAGYSGVSNSYNVYLGNYAGQAATSSYGVHLGYSANYNCTTGEANTTVGYNAAYYTTTGGYNSAYGSAALQSNTTGVRCSAVGASSLLYNTTGNYNTAIGFQSLALNTTSQLNAAIGYQAGYAQTTGGYNSYLGAYAGDNVTTGSNITVIGYNADASSATATNEVTLGNSSVATLRCQVALTVLSDERDKKNIETLGNASDFIKALRPVSFDWNQRDGERMGQSDHGFIAQELKTAQEETNWHVPRLVYESNPDKLEASYATLLPSVVSALQEALAEIESLKAQVAQLSGD